MNALNILSGIGAGNSGSAPQSRAASLSAIRPLEQGQSGSDTDEYPNEKEGLVQQEATEQSDGEKAPLLGKSEADQGQLKSWRLVPKSAADVTMTAMKVVLATILAPIHFMVSVFYDEHGNFSMLGPLRKIHLLSGRRKRRKAGQQSPHMRSFSEDQQVTKHKTRSKRHGTGVFGAAPAAESSDGFKSESSEGEMAGAELDDSPARNTRSKTAVDTSAPKRSIRIKIQSDAAQKSRHRSQRSMDGITNEDDRLQAVANALKSPSSPATKLKYPRAPAPPRPLVPRRQPSYANIFNPDTPKKTLILDLDETLIHSMAKGGRMSTGHMVEVKFQGPIGGSGMVLGPQVPILYYVHERPHCHEFLRKVCKWFNLIVFTASVQEYADPVIDWLERERSYFVGRYYRQHCTFRNGAYIKDLSQVEPDLSKVMILDNSPMSYIFHEDNAIPIEGWISDPTDNDLLHLVPLLEGLQYVTDVRALLALRMGQTERSQ